MLCLNQILFKLKQNKGDIFKDSDRPFAPYSQPQFTNDVCRSLYFIIGTIGIAFAS